MILPMLIMYEATEVFYQRMTTVLLPPDNSLLFQESPPSDVNSI